jgi:dihydrofolate synthase / folylpolyglutamate synthase
VKKMNVSEWLTHIKSFSVKQINLSLERVILVSGRLGLLTPKELVISVAGTNGKGSSVSGLESIYLAQGYRVGAFTSPFLFHYNEQIRLQGQNVSDERLCDAFSIVSSACVDVALTPFEFGTLAAFVIFEQAKLDVRILEIGLGGRYDAVNAIDADISLVTSIGLDHTEWLGTTRDSIGYEKAGIFRPGKPAVCGDADPPKRLIDYAQQLGAPLFCQGRDFNYQSALTSWTFNTGSVQYHALPKPSLLLQNMASVLMVIELAQSRLPVSRAAIDAGLQRVYLPGRIQVIAGEYECIFDVSHNPASIEMLAGYLKTHPLPGKTYAVFSMLADKDIVESIRAICEGIDEWHVAPLSCDRVASFETLTNGFQQADIKNTCFYESIEQAYAAAKNKAKKGDRIVVFGSFHTVSACAVKPKEAAIL